MTPQLFHPGQQVVCIEKKFIPVTELSKGAPDPIYNQLYHVRKYEKFNHYWFISLVEFSDVCIYAQDCFAPLMDIHELIEESKIENVLI